MSKNNRQNKADNDLASIVTEKESLECFYMYKHTLKIHIMKKLAGDEKSVMKHFRTNDLKTTSTLVSFSINFFISINISNRLSLEVIVLEKKHR
jgi:hypothetical protein